MADVFQLLQDEISADSRNTDLFLATVANVNSSGVTLILDGESEASTKRYKYMTSGYAEPAAGDRVVVMKMSGTYVALGRIGSSPKTTEEKVNRSGDTMTGDLRLRNKSLVSVVQTISLSQRPSSLVSQIAHDFRDVSSRYFGRIMALQRSDGRAGIDIGAVRSVNGAQVLNTVEMTIDDSGNRKILLSNAAAWLDALGPGLITTTTVSEIFSSITSGFTVSDAYYAQFGKVAMFSALFTPDHNRTSTAWLMWATLASGKRPAHGIVGGCQATSYCEIDANGEIYIALQYSSGGGYRVSATYLLP